MQQINLITGNNQKFEEFKKEISNLVKADIDLPELQSLNTKKIIKYKLQAATKFRPDLDNFIVEDSAIYFDGLKGLPGPLIKWFLKSLGTKGLYEFAWNQNIDTVKLETVIGFYSRELKQPKYFSGLISGKLTYPREGRQFGWDPIVIPNGYSKTLSQMSIQEKSNASQRGLAIRKLKAFLEENFS
jgi:non-canonical purine NTP pyrophosphatase (RdgB/HAM1 family)